MGSDNVEDCFLGKGRGLEKFKQKIAKFMYLAPGEGVYLGK